MSFLLLKVTRIHFQIFRNFNIFRNLYLMDVYKENNVPTLCRVATIPEICNCDSRGAIQSRGHPPR